jgi:uncharacterized membrane protein
VTAASTYMLVFRTLHILGAIAWGGSIFLMVFFLQPAAKAVGPAAGPFMRELLATRKLLDVVLGLAATTIVAGGFLYWNNVDTAGSLGDLLDTNYGVAITLGAISALIAFGIGWFATRPAVKRTLVLGGQIAQAGASPPAELVQELQATQAKARTLAKVNFTFVALAALFMATARYW